MSLVNVGRLVKCSKDQQSYDVGYMIYYYSWVRVNFYKSYSFIAEQKQ